MIQGPAGGSTAHLQDGGAGDMGLWWDKQPRASSGLGRRLARVGGLGGGVRGGDRPAWRRLSLTSV